MCSAEAGTRVELAVLVERLVCLGLSHRTAPVELRERFGTLGLGAERCPEVLEHAVLATCYRVELYAYLVDGVENARDALVDALAEVHGVERSALVEHLYVHAGEDVARHLSRVAAGLDSLVLGEAEILGQVRDAFGDGSDDVGQVLPLLARTAVTSGRRARSETAIGTNPATASSMALALAEGVLGDIPSRRVLVVGAGRIGLQTLKAVTARGIGNVAVANRTRETAEDVARRFGGVPYGLDELADALAWADLVVTATSSERPILGASSSSGNGGDGPSGRSSSSISPCPPTSTAQPARSTESASSTSTTCAPASTAPSPRACRRCRAWRRSWRRRSRPSHAATGSSRWSRSWRRCVSRPR